MSYTLTGLFAAMGGLALTMATGIGTPTARPVHPCQRGCHRARRGQPGRWSWWPAGGRSIAVFILRLVRTDLTFLGIDPNYTTVIEGLVMVIVVMVGAVVALRRKRA